MQRLRAGSIGIVILSVLTAMGARAQDEPPPQTQTFAIEEIDSLVAPVALYPDSLLAQVLMASTYPLEVVEASRFARANPDLADDALNEALKDKSWDASVKSLVSFPQVLTMMDEKLDWTQKLGDAFLAQQTDVMDAVQRLRAKAKAEGNLESNEQQKVIVEQAPAPPPRRGDRPAGAAEPDGDRDRARRSAGRVRAHLQPHRRLRRVGLSRLSALLLLPARLCARALR